MLEENKFDKICSTLQHKIIFSFLLKKRTKKISIRIYKKNEKVLRIKFKFKNQLGKYSNLKFRKLDQFKHYCFLKGNSFLSHHVFGNHLINCNY